MGRRNGLPENERYRILGMFESGRTVRDIAHAVNVHRSTVYNLIDRYRQTGTPKDRPRSGRPKAMTPREERYVMRTSTRDRFRPATRIALDLRNATGVQVSAQTIRNRLHSGGMNARRPHQGMELTDRHKQQRLEWANRHVRWTVRDWRSVLFSDESRFCVKFADGRIRVWRRKGERFNENCVMPRDRFGGGSLMIWGGVHYTGKTDLVVLRQTLTAQRYCDLVLNPVVLPFMTQNQAFTFQHDNARPHTARLTTQLLTGNNIQTLPWPSRSPDLAPIEHVWDILGRRVRSNHQDIHNLDQLENAIVREWNAMPQQDIQKILRGMRKRCTAVINANGAWTRY